MGRPRKKNLSVSLFPFLSILACVLGVLTLMITSVVLTQIDDESVLQAKQDVMDRKFEEIQGLEENIKQQRNWLGPTQNQVDQAKVLQDLVAQVEDLKKQTHVTAKSEVEMRKQIAALQKQNKAMQSQLTSMKAEIPKMEQDLERRNNPAGYATVTVRRSNSALGEMINPVFIECDKAGLVVYNPKGDADFKVATGNITKDPKIKQLVQQIVKLPQLRTWRSRAGTKMEASFVKRYPGFVELRKKDGKILKFNPNQLTLKCQDALAEIDKSTKAGKKPPQGHYIIFLVRPDGIPAWATGRNFCWNLNCKNGKLPIASMGAINLKTFLN